MPYKGFSFACRAPIGGLRAVPSRSAPINPRSAAVPARGETAASQRAAQRSAPQERHRKAAAGAAG